MGARRPSDPSSAAPLTREAEAGGGAYLTFLFALDEWWTTMTDGRAPSRKRCARACPRCARRTRYLETGDACWSRSAVVLTRESAADRASARRVDEFLVEAIVGPRDEPLMNMNAYLHKLRAASAPAGPAVRN